MNKYEFRLIDWSKEKKNGTILYIGRSNDFNEDTKAINTINYINGDAAIKIVDR